MLTLRNPLLRDADAVSHGFTKEFTDGTDEFVEFDTRHEAEAARLDALQACEPNVSYISHVYRAD